MIQGYFDTRAGGAAAPHVIAAVRTTATGAFEVLDFLIDTGADFTTINPSDAYRLWGTEYLAYDFLTDPTRTEVRGIGGTAVFVVRSVFMAFCTEDNRSITADHNVHVASPPATDLWQLSSLLGRDILSQFRCTFDYSQNLVGFDLLGVSDAADPRPPAGIDLS